MGIDAFVIRFQVSGDQFIPLFLSSPDFDRETLKRICQGLHVPTSGDKNQLIDHICDSLKLQDEGHTTVLQALIDRPKPTVSMKLGSVRFPLPRLNDPVDLIYGAGKQAWYGPIQCTTSNHTAWYIRPVFVRHWERDNENDAPEERIIRWLCFARITPQMISLHWRGFTHAGQVSEVDTSHQFEYWNRIPKLFGEIEAATKAQVEYLNLHKLVLHDLWEKYRSDSSYRWTDKRIRAESGGVAVSARAGASYDKELDVGGIRNLARVIRKSIELELKRAALICQSPNGLMMLSYER